jgi:hypothetical protein
MKINFALSAALLVFGVFSSLSLNAAPMPATSTSKLVAPQLGIYRSPLGFEVAAGSSGWVHGEAPSNNKFIATLYHSPKAKNSKDAPSLTVRVDKLEKEVALEKYIQKWMKEYPKYGFDVLNSRTFTENKQKGYFLDLKNKDNGKQLRQVVFLKQKTAVILTCRDKSTTFKDTLKSCNQIIRTFAWNN